jgi:hypothetical protein
MAVPIIEWTPEQRAELDEARGRASESLDKLVDVARQLAADGHEPHNIGRVIAAFIGDEADKEAPGQLAAYALSGLIIAVLRLAEQRGGDQ